MEKIYNLKEVSWKGEYQESGIPFSLLVAGKIS
jgi:hypothetical protein